MNKSKLLLGDSTKYYPFQSYGIHWVLKVMVLITVAAATLCISPPLIAQQQCGVTANLVLVGRDTITGQYGPIPRCIYDVYLNNSRNDIAQVFCTPDSPSVIWWANAGPPTWATGNSLPHFWFIPYGGYIPPIQT